MKWPRRRFLQSAGSVALLATAGCELPQALGVVGPAKAARGPLTAPDGDEVDEIAHVLGRLSHGPRPGDYHRVREMGVDAYIEEQLHPESIDDAWCDYRVRRFESLRQPVGELFEYQEHLLLKELSEATVVRAVYSERQLYEVMAGFWTDHFNIDSSKGDCPWLKTADDREVIRRHALGRFSDLLRASALSPAMLWYLDGRSNRRSSPDEQPNENYARELLELHTLGVHGGYTQADIMELARCLTGWHVRTEELFKKGKVEFKPDAHDQGEKAVLGEVIPAGLGEADLDRVLAIVTRHPATANYVAEKLCRKFIADTPPPAAVRAVADTFQTTEGGIRATLKTLFAHEEFRAARGAKMKRPLHYLASALRVSDADSSVGEPVMEYLLRMGHAPFQYPTPDGYPDEAGPWMGTLLWRWHFAKALDENRLGGTQVNWAALREAAGGDEVFMRHVLGRRPRPDEARSYLACNNSPAVLLASPAFQRY